VIRSVLYLRARDDRHAEVVDFYRRHRVLERAVQQDGCLGAELQLPTSGRGELLVTALWRDVDAYRGWLENPSRAESAAELEQLLDHFQAGISGETYQIVLGAEPQRCDGHVTAGPARDVHGVPIDDLGKEKRE
jgi:heme-degrading monooxygenase HmoA